MAWPKGGPLALWLKRAPRSLGRKRPREGSDRAKALPLIYVSEMEKPRTMPGLWTNECGIRTHGHAGINSDYANVILLRFTLRPDTQA